MRDANLRHLAQLAPKLEKGTLARSDAMALFIMLRDEPTGDAMVRDIANCVAHSVRDRNNGIAKNTIDAAANQLRCLFENGGYAKPIGEVLYPIGDVIEEICCELRGLNIDFNAQDIRQQEQKLASVFLDMLDGVEVVGSDWRAKMNDPSHSCTFEFDNVNQNLQIGDRVLMTLKML